MKDAKQFLQEANAVVPRISAADGIENMLLATACSLMFAIAAILPKAARSLVRFGFHADFWNLRLMKTCPISMQASAKMPISFLFAVLVDRPRWLARR